MNNTLAATILGMPSMVDFWLVVLISVATSFLAVFMSTKMLQILQLSGYKTKGCLEWLKQTKYNYVGRLVMVSVLSAAAMLITNVLLDEFLIVRPLKYISIIFFFVFSLIYIVNVYTVPQKTPIKYTHRMNRLVAVIWVLSLIVSFWLMVLSVNYIPYFTAGGAVLVPAVLPVVILFGHLLTCGIEKAVAKKFINRAKDTLAKHTDLKVVGVTGSYGKTTVKNIIATMLAEKYKVCVTPFSYNTPLGLSKTILENLEEDDQVLVAEMGARSVGDIAELCDMVQPSVGVITGIGNQHMATFGSMEKIIQTKGEIDEYIVNRRGTMVYNIDSLPAQEMFTKSKANKYAVGINHKQDIFAEDLKCTSEGSEFTLHIKSKKYKAVKTSLLGEHNISNILIAVCVAKQFGLSDEQIIEGIKKLTPTAHRLAIIPSASALIVIDDAYNGSVEGTKSALNVLSKFEGKKVVITPGLVELGAEQFNSNFEFARSMAAVVDYVIITGVVNYDAISSGLEFAGFDVSKIIRAGNLNQAVSMLANITNPGDVVLFENDLPDNYI